MLLQKTKTARSFKLALLIADTDKIIWQKLTKNILFFELLPFANFDIENLISKKLLQIGAANLLSL